MAKNSIEQMNPGKQGIADILSAQFAANGFRLVTSASTLDADERYYFIQAAEDTVITCTNNAGGDNPSSFTLLAGLHLGGVFSNLTVSSGTLIAYIL